MDCCPIIYWLCVALTKMVVSDKSPLVIPRPTVPLADGDLLRHRNHMLNQTPPELYPTLQSVQGSLIVTHIWEVMVQLGTGPTGDHPHLSSSAFVRYFPMKTPPPIWKELVGAPKRQHLATLQRALEDTACRLSIRMPIVAIPILLKLTLA